MKGYALVLLLVTVCPCHSIAQRAIPDDNLAYPVLITLSDCSSIIGSVKGSGFLLNTGSEVYLVTARHVLFNEAERVQPGQARPLQCKKAELVSYSRDPKDRQQNRFEVDMQALNEGSKVRAHPTRDVAVIQIGVNRKNQDAVADRSKPEYILEVFSEVRPITTAPSGLLSVGMETVKRFGEVLTANDVYVSGYPSSIGVQQAPQIDYSAPLLRKGIVAGVNESNKTIVLDCLTFFGNSGGPVLQAVHVGLSTRFDVIGVIIQYVPLAENWVNTTFSYSYMQLHNSGYSIAEPMDSVLELVGK